MQIAFFGDSLTSGVPGSSYVAVLHRRFPGDTLLNFGKANDTVVSLHRRISRSQLDRAFDMACLWIGVNDVPQRDWWPYRAFHTLLGQRRARDTDEFLACYRATLGLLCGHAKRVIVIPPLLKGEDLDNPPNHRLAVLAGYLRDITTHYERADFLDLRAMFARELAQKPVAHRVLGSPFRLLLDALTLRTDEQIDRKAAERGLHLTLDGVHLNSAGAQLVAAEVARLVEEWRAARALGDELGTRALSDQCS